jgi:RimJ/RimL family protein N-acetyltransferase
MGVLSPREHQLPNGASVRVRSALPDDAAAVIACALPVFEQDDTVMTGPGEFTMTVEQEREFLEARLRDETGLFVIAEADHADGPRVVGILSLGAIKKRRVLHNVTLGISIAAAWRGQKLGRLLILEALEWAAAHPRIERVCLEVVAGNERGLRLYESLGFVREGYRIGHFQRSPGVYDDDIIMVRRVKPMPARQNYIGTADAAGRLAPEIALRNGGATS